MIITETFPNVYSRLCSFSFNPHLIPTFLSLHLQEAELLLDVRHCAVEQDVHSSRCAILDTNKCGFVQ